MNKSVLKEYGLITVGTLLVSIGVYFFKFPNNFSFGGVTGVAIVISKWTNGVISSSSANLIISMVLLLIGFIFLGKKCGIKTAYGSILLSGSISLLEIIYPLQKPLTDSPMLELCFAVALPAFGSAILFNIEASTGGTDIIAMILKKYTSINIGKSLFYTDIIVTALAFLVFDLTTGLYSLLGLAIKSLMVDSVIENLNLCKYFNVVCKNPQPICDYINNVLHRGATICEAKGAFSGDDKTIIFTVMSRHQALKLRKFIKEIEPDAFVLISNTSEIIGRGFRA